VTVDEFRATLAAHHPPLVSPLLRALWHDARGDWDGAHSIAQDIDDAGAAWVHAYLHRKEGDLGNAAYWYRRADRPVATDPLETEWVRIVAALLERSDV
jgi:hypothetical protein